MLPTDVFDAAYILANNSIGGNVGNLIYAYSVYRTLTTEDVEFTPDYYRVNQSDASYINDNYDAYIIPLADAFRPEFEKVLKTYTALINKLTIPVYVIGVGLRADFEPDLTKTNDFDDTVKKFVKAVLNKSSMIGVRGEITSKYLSNLGFREGIDHLAIGCPSMYAFGENLKIRDTKITKDSIVTVNSSKLSPDNVLDFITRSQNEFENHYFIPQWLKELRLTYLGGPNLGNPKPNYPSFSTDPVYQNDRVRYFLNAQSWIDFIGKADLSFGARLHGNITATIAGTPSIIIPKDGRMRELTEFHSLNNIWAKDITPQTNIFDLVEKSDFHSCERVHANNFQRYLNFLNKNNLDHIYKESTNPTVIPLDEQLKTLDMAQPLRSFVDLSATEIRQRYDRFYNLSMETSDEKLRKERRIVKELQKTTEAQKIKINYLERTLNRKAVKMALKTANIFAKSK